MEFEVGDKVFLKASPTKGIKRFGLSGKLSPRYTSPYEIIEKLNPIAYLLDLPTELEHVYNVFHISQLRKHIADPNHAIASKPVEITADLVHKEHRIKILDCRIKQLHNKQAPLVKPIWTNRTSQDATWETEDKMQSNYPHLFKINLHVLSRLISFEDETL